MRFPINPRFTAKKVQGDQWSVFDMHTGRTANVNGIVLGKLDHGMAVDLANSLNPKAPSIRL
ncbi:hypothetical protein ACDY96_19740 [Rhizobium mongolense]|uniref:hypothetical protein n=1 Tax=Rhizobium TaxID=379 RepID=UPI001EF97691|nr:MULTISPECIES: hypothetical protein [Rhizobium]ULJ71029.1 hypothetical protein L2W42_14065 [Rhizobium gallicum]WFU87781.1 hypothetical protein QA644_01390 [Rhizobium sp. CC1099]